MKIKNQRNITSTSRHLRHQFVGKTNYHANSLQRTTLLRLGVQDTSYTSLVCTVKPSGVDRFPLVGVAASASASACKFHIMFFHGMVNYMVVHIGVYTYLV